MEGEIAADDLCLAADGQIETLSCVLVQQETQLGFDLRDTSNVAVCVRCVRCVVQQGVSSAIAKWCWHASLNPHLDIGCLGVAEEEVGHLA